MEVFWYSIYNQILAFAAPILEVGVVLFIMWLFTIESVVVFSASNRQLVEDISKGMIEFSKIVQAKTYVSNKFQPSTGWNISFKWGLLIYMYEQGHYGNRSFDVERTIYIYGFRSSIVKFIESFKFKPKHTEVGEKEKAKKNTKQLENNLNSFDLIHEINDANDTMPLLDLNDYDEEKEKEDDNDEYDNIDLTNKTALISNLVSNSDSDFGLDSETETDDDKSEDTYEYILVNNSHSWDVFYSRMEFKKNKFITQQQMNIVNEIKAIYENSTKKYASTSIIPQLSIMLYGEPGVGKSTVGNLLASALNGSLAIVDIMSRGLSVSNIYDQYANGVDKPLILITNEFETVLDKIYNKEKQIGGSKEEIVPLVHDKMSLNNFLDSLKQYAGIIFIATTNKPLEYYDSDEHKSHVRDGRFDLKIKMDPINPEEMNDITKQICKSYRWPKNDINAFINKISSIKGVTIASLIRVFRIYEHLGMDKIISVLNEQKF
jgi:SpoVK/Ycf46/Vps4 family AAA+-type ATPase